MDPSINIDYTTASLSDLQNQMIKSFQNEDDRCVQPNNINDCQQRMLIFILQQKLQSIQLNYSKLKIENDQLRQNNVQQRSTITDLQEKITILKYESDKQIVVTKNQIEMMINQHQKEIEELNIKLEHKMNEYENHITRLSQQIIDCEQKYDKKICKIKDQWKFKYSRLKQKFKTTLIEDEWRMKYLQLEQKMKPSNSLMSRDKITVKMGGSCCNKHQCNWFGYCHYAPAIILLIIMVILLIVWNKCVQFAKKSSCLICRKVVFG